MFCSILEWGKDKEYNLFQEKKNFRCQSYCAISQSLLVCPTSVSFYLSLIHTYSLAHIHFLIIHRCLSDPAGCLSVVGVCLLHIQLHSRDGFK